MINLVEAAMPLLEPDWKVAVRSFNCVKNLHFCKASRNEQKGIRAVRARFEKFQGKNCVPLQRQEWGDDSPGGKYIRQGPQISQT
jgi:hypothetical protein